MDRDRVYTVEELVFLADSPLCAPPASMRPCEEWMSPITTPAVGTTRRTKADGEHVDDDARRFTETTDQTSKLIHPDNIVLGPPKISFGSSFRKLDGEGLDKQQLPELLTSRVLNKPDGANGKLTARLSAFKVPAPPSTAAAGEELHSKDGIYKIPRKTGDEVDSARLVRRFNDTERKPDSATTSTATIVAAAAVRGDVATRKPILRKDEGSWRERNADHDRSSASDKWTSSSANTTTSGGRYTEKTPEWFDVSAPAMEHHESLNLRNSEFANAVSSATATLQSPSTVMPPAAPAATVASSRTTSSAGGGGEQHSVADFEAWKARMRAADNERKSKEYDGDTPSGGSKFFGPTVTEMPSMTAPSEIRDSFFGFETYKSKVDSRGSSRFSSFFKTGETTVTPKSPELPTTVESLEALPAAITPLTTPPVSAASTARATLLSALENVSQSTSSGRPSPDLMSDKEGFKRIMAKLSSVPPAPAAAPVPTHAFVVSPPQTNAVVTSPQMPPVAPHQHAPQPTRPSKLPIDDPAIIAAPVASPKALDSNAQFLMGLMSGSSKMRVTAPRPPPPQVSDDHQPPPPLPPFKHTGTMIPIASSQQQQQQQQPQQQHILMELQQQQQRVNSNGGAGSAYPPPGLGMPSMPLPNGSGPQQQPQYGVPRMPPPPPPQGFPQFLSRNTRQGSQQGGGPPPQVMHADFLEQQQQVQQAQAAFGGAPPPGAQGYGGYMSEIIRGGPRMLPPPQQQQQAVEHYGPPPPMPPGMAPPTSQQQQQQQQAYIMRHMPPLPPNMMAGIGPGQGVRVGGVPNGYNMPPPGYGMPPPGFAAMQQQQQQLQQQQLQQQLQQLQQHRSQSSASGMSDGSMSELRR
ncbi:uncharacterized protein V1518DRAFT_405676 [Limtongia smithiae]|uniref:uncharacterized protein n=1 Tax=Limtongia smithiae TaxID=1125753 RepID=UPI0034CEB9CC